MWKPEEIQLAQRQLSYVLQSNTHSLHVSNSHLNAKWLPSIHTLIVPEDRLALTQPQTSIEDFATWFEVHLAEALCTPSPHGLTALEWLSHQIRIAAGRKTYAKQKQIVRAGFQRADQARLIEFTSLGLPLPTLLQCQLVAWGNTCSDPLWPSIEPILNGAWTGQQHADTAAQQILTILEIPSDDPVQSHIGLYEYRERNEANEPIGDKPIGTEPDFPEGIEGTPVWTNGEGFAESTVPGRPSVPDLSNNFERLETYAMNLARLLKGRTDPAPTRTHEDEGDFDVVRFARNEAQPFERKGRPNVRQAINVTLALDTSYSTAGATLREERDLGLIIAMAAKRAQSVFRAASFNNHVRVLAEPHTDPGKALHNINSICASGGTSLIPALIWALKFQTTTAHHVVFLVSDGKVDIHEREILGKLKQQHPETTIIPVCINNGDVEAFSKALGAGVIDANNEDLIGCIRKRLISLRN